MGKKRVKKNTGKRAFVQLESGLADANRDIISINKKQIHRVKGFVEMIIERLTRAMKKESSVFSKLYVKRFGSGSAFEGLKIVKPDELDIDMLFKIPEIAKPVLYESDIPGHVLLKLEEFQRLQEHSPDIYNEIKKFVDKDNYLLVDKMMSTFMQSIFDRTFTKSKNLHYKDIVKIGKKKFTIERVQFKNPALKLSIQATNFKVSVDLVPCILIKPEQWPKNGFRQNPLTFPTEFFIVPKSPKRKMPHVERYWRLSFQKQEIAILYSRSWLKPTIRVLKCIRDHFGQQKKVSSYALKTLFFWELVRDNPTLEPGIPELWTGPLSHCVIHMLEMYLEHLENGKIPYFWNSKLNLLENLREEQINECKNQIASALEDIRGNPSSETILKYLEISDQLPDDLSEESVNQALENFKPSVLPDTEIDSFDDFVADLITDSGSDTEIDNPFDIDFDGDNDFSFDNDLDEDLTNDSRTDTEIDPFDIDFDEDYGFQF